MTSLDQPTSLARLPALLADRLEHKVAVRVGDATLSYRDLERGSESVARALRRDGIEAGDRIAVLARDSLATVQVLFGAARARAVCVPVDGRLAAEEIAYVLDDSGAKVVFVDRASTPVFDRALAKLESVPKSIDLTGDSECMPRFESWRSAAPPQDSPGAEVFHPDEVVVQMYTSGTTGLPKGVQLPNRSFFAIAQALASAGDPWMGWGEHDVNLMFVPTFHIGGLWWLVRGLAIGSTHIILPTFDPGRVLDAIPRYGVTKTGMVPAMLQVLLSEPGCATTDFSSLRTILYGGAPMAPALLERARATFGCEFCQIYGMTETGNMAVTLRPEEHWTGPAERMWAAGRPLPGVELRIEKRNGEPAGSGELGEICLRSPAQMIGYWKLPEATASVMADGWIKTGDSGYQDSEGYLYVCDRIKDMIISCGENVYPAEIERVLSEHAAVADVCVIGVPDPLWGEAALAFVVARPGAELVARDLLRDARQRLAEFKVPRRIEFVERLPRNANGKVLRRVLRAPYWRDRARNVN